MRGARWVTVLMAAGLACVGCGDPTASAGAAAAGTASAGAASPGAARADVGGPPAGPRATGPGASPTPTTSASTGRMTTGPAGVSPAATGAASAGPGPAGPVTGGASGGPAASARTGVTGAAAGGRGGPAQVWRRDAATGGAAPVVGQGLLFTAEMVNSHPSLAATDLATGAPRWQHPEPTLQFLRLAPAAGRLYATTMPTEEVRAYDAGTGRLVWKALGGTHLHLGDPAVGGGLVLVTDDFQNELYALRTADGSVAWRRVVGDALHPVTGSAPAVADGAVYLGLGCNTVTRLDLATGAVRWRQADRDCGSAGRAGVPVVQDGRVWLPPEIGSAGLVLNADSGQVLRSLDTAASPLPAAGLMVLTEPDRLTAVSPADGAVRWRTPPAPHGVRPPRLVGSTVVVDESRGLHGYDAATGRLRWALPPDDPAFVAFGDYPSDPPSGGVLPAGGLFVYGNRWHVGVYRAG